MTIDFDQLRRTVEELEARIPFNRLLGLELEDFGPDRVVVAVEHRPDLVGNFARGNLHGGVISATLDLVGGLVACAAGIAEEGIEDLAEAERWFSGFGTIDLRVDYLRPAMGERFTAQGTVLRIGRRVAVTRMEFHNQDDALLAAATGTYILPG